LYGAENWKIWKIDQIYLKSCEIWRCKRVEISTRIDRVKSEGVLHRVKMETMYRLVTS
jgi:hypothetical protein